MNSFHNNFKRFIPLAAKDLSISLSLKHSNIPLNVCKCSTEKTYSTRDIGTQTIRKCNSKSSTLLQDYMYIYFLPPSGIEPATDVLYHNVSVALPTLYLSDDRVRLKFCESTVNMPYANGQQIRVENTKSSEVLEIVYMRQQPVVSTILTSLKIQKFENSQIIC